MQKIYGSMRKAIQKYNLIENGDVICVGVSGGKDSVVLLLGLVGLRKFINIDFQIKAVTLDPQFHNQPNDYSAIEKLCAELDIPYKVIPTHISEIVFDIRKEKNPCSLCAKLRRGALHEATAELGCNKIALGHHYNDAVETFMMNLFTVGQIACYAPKSYLTKHDITLIRPLCLTEEKDIYSAVHRLNLPVVKSKCPVDGTTNRESMKLFLAEREKTDKGFTRRIFNAMCKKNIDDWGGVDWVDRSKFHGRPEDDPRNQKNNDTF